MVENDFDESNWVELGALTNMLDEVESHPRLLRSLSFGDPDYGGNIIRFLKEMIGENNENLGVVYDYVTKNCRNEGENISSEEIEGRKIIFTPSIFDIPTKPIDSNLVSVMMPFKSELSDVYSAIKDAASAVDLSCTRADDIWDHSTVVQDIFSLIYRSNIVVCDFTDKNPNVFYEAGIAHTLGKHVVPIAQSDHDIPFDLRHHRYAKYLNNTEGLNKLKSDLESRFTTLKHSQNSLSL